MQGDTSKGEIAARRLAAKDGGTPSADAVSDGPKNFSIPAVVGSGEACPRKCSFAKLRGVGVAGVRSRGNFQIAGRHGFGLVASGDYGRYEGSSADEVVFKAYAQSGRWSQQFHEQLAEPLFAGGKGTLVDVGANIGLTSVPVARKHGVRCFAFEPDPDNFLLLRGNSLRNGTEASVAAENLALSSSVSELEFELSPNNHGDHRIRFSSTSNNSESALGEEKRSVIKVKATTFDEYFRNKSLEAPLLVKVDTQGAELHVLRGMKESFRRVDFLVLEFWPYGLNRSNSDLGDLFDLFENFPLELIRK